ncbi:hypothetical protein PILCRDRAFT_10967 [Piloderma croceum F 1598]|uniref:Uncharacterized protein n=1 Tax=Piloderma croceum (strain F 1598) TaxID=765440 RepID=A0A0C3F1V1_PILCF|nr:hypothetical protein PILCRDRAFT_10967 [Piloderma croceum F 1598]
MLVDELGELLDRFQGSLMQVQCFAHILNNLLLSHKTKATANADEDAEDTATLNKLNYEQLGEYIENENKDYSEEDKDGEINMAVAESDAAIVNKVAADVTNDSAQPTLTHDEVNLSRFAMTKLSKNEWDLLEKFFPLLEVFLIMMKQISQSKTPLMHEVIPIFDVINHALDKHIDDTTLPATVRMAAAHCNVYDIL